MLPYPDVAAPPPRPIVGGVALESPHFHLGKAHHYQELGKAGAHLVGLAILEPSQVEAFNMLSVVGQRSYSNAQANTQRTRMVRRGPAARTVLYAFWPIFWQHVSGEQH